MRPEGSAEELEKRRRRAIDLLKEGYSQAKVAEMIGSSQGSVSRWHKLAVEGAEALTLKPHPGRPRGLAKQKMLELISSRWVHAHQNLIITGKTGLGKTYLPCALGNKACRDGYRVLYTRAPQLFGALYQARADGTYPRVLQRLARTHVLIIDDLGAAPLEPQERRDLREVLEDRYGVSSTVITSQLDSKHWHSFIGDETLADAICDRLVHNAHSFKLDGESIRTKYGLRGPKSETKEEK